jgi:hypothetical protein
MHRSFYRSCYTALYRADIRQTNESLGNIRIARYCREFSLLGRSHYRDSLYSLMLVVFSLTARATPHAPTSSR